MITAKDLKNFIDNGRRAQKEIDKFFEKKEDHSIKFISKDEWRITCRNQNKIMALPSEPNFCPMCGEDFK